MEDIKANQQHVVAPEKLRSENRLSVLTDEVSEEDVEAAESEEVVDDLMRLVMDDMDRASQPMTVGAINMCELAKSKNLVSLRLALLKEICNEFQLTTSGP